MSPHRTLKRAAATAAVAALAVVGGAVTAAPASAASCSVSWGSTAKKSAPMSSRELTNVRSGRHKCYDRLVIDLNGAAATSTGYDVRYVPAVVQDGSGLPVPLRGAADLQIVLKAPAYDTNGDPTYNPADPDELVNVSGYSTFRQVAFAGSFEGLTTIGLGVRARLPMRVKRIAGPGTAQRVVIDVAHHW